MKESKTLDPRTTPVTWELLVRLEPGLGSLERLCAALSTRGADDWPETWRRDVQPLMRRLVGGLRETVPVCRDPEKSTWTAEDLERLRNEKPRRDFTPEPGSWEALLAGFVAYCTAHEHLMAIVSGKTTA